MSEMFYKSMTAQELTSLYETGSLPEEMYKIYLDKIAEYISELETEVYNLECELNKEEDDD